MKDLKTFKDLVFEPHPYIPDCEQARMTLSDGTNISVLNGGYGVYSTKDVSYEIMSDRIVHDVRGWQSKKQITRHMLYCQNNPK